jgi:GxxExxY protein
MNDFYKWDITYKIIGCAMKVHNELWCWFPEVVYQRALLLEFQKAGLTFEREKNMQIHYDGTHVWNRRVDFLVDEDIMVELKATTKIEDVNKAQLINYLEVYKVKIWLLINFWNKKMEYFRFIK